jgi:hypothetical protein
VEEGATEVVVVTPCVEDVSVVVTVVEVTVGVVLVTGGPAEVVVVRVVELVGVVLVAVVVVVVVIVVELVAVIVVEVVAGIVVELVVVVVPGQTLVTGLPAILPLLLNTPPQTVPRLLMDPALFMVRVSLLLIIPPGSTMSMPPKLLSTSPPAEFNTSPKLARLP